MAKDPAFLFYYQDFLVGSDHMSNEQCGAYIRCLCHQGHRGSIRPEHMSNICASHDVLMIVREKFNVDPDGSYFNVKLRDEITKRKNYTESRRQNRTKHKSNICSTHDEHMENENENILSSNKLLLDRFNTIWERYPNKIKRKDALRHFKASVKSDKSWGLINKALDNYLIHCAGKESQYIQVGSTWFNNWEDWIENPIVDKEAEAEAAKSSAEFQRLQKQFEEDQRRANEFAKSNTDKG